MPLPESYQRFIRTHLRFALAMALVALLSGISFQESGRKVTFALAPAGAHLELLLGLALVHGHAFVMGVLLPTAMAGMLVLGLRIGAPAVSDRALAWTTALYLPGTALSVALMLYKGYHFVLGARYHVADVATLHAAVLGGQPALRAGLYGAVHTILGAGLAIFAWALWRSLGRRAA